MPGVLGPLIGEGRALPGKIEIAPPEVAVGGDLAVDGPAQLERAHDPEGREIDVLVDQRRDHVGGHLLGPEGLDQHRDRLGDADRVGDLDLALRRQAGGDDVLRRPARAVGGAAIDLGRVLAAEGAAAMARVAAVGVDDDLATGEAGVRHAGRR